MYVTFDTNQAYLDGAARAILDDVALRLTSQANSKLLLISSLAPREGQGVEEQRLENVSAYIAKRGGDSDLSRIVAHPGGAECKLPAPDQGCVELVFITEKDDVDQVVRDCCSGFTAPPN